MSEPAAHAAPPSPAAPTLARRLGAVDATLLTVGSMIGTGIFLTSSDMAKVLPGTGWLVAVWALGGLLTLAGALTYAELGAMYTGAGGMYVFLREAYGRPWAFLFGWTAFTVSFSGGIAAIAVGFGVYLGGFVPFFGPAHTLWELPFAGLVWRVDGAQLAAVLAIVVLTAVNHLGVREGARVQNALTAIKLGAVALFVVGGFLVAAPQHAPSAPAASAATATGGGALLVAVGVAMIAALWTYDGWYGITFSAGEMRRPERDLPVGLVLGTAAVTALYVVVNAVYVRALPLAAIAAAPRVGEAAATALFGAAAGRLLAGAIVLSTLGCLSATILYSARIYQPMAADGLFFRRLAAIHPRHRTPAASLWAQAAWSSVLALSGRYDQLYTYAMFVVVLFHVLTGAAVFVLRRSRPDLPRPYRAWGYPWIPAAFVVASLLLLGNTLVERPVESLFGLALAAVGVPLYLFWRRSAPPGDDAG